MSDEPKGAVNAVKDTEEWSTDDPRWDEPATFTRTEAGERAAFYSRKYCPLIPLHDYVILEAFDFQMYTPGGLALASRDSEMAQLKPVVLMVVAAGPDAIEDYKPGDMVMTNPHNSELGYEWDDPDYETGTRTFMMMKKQRIIARLDNEVIGQFSARADRCEREREERQRADAKEKADHEKVLSSPLHPNPLAKEGLVDARGEPISKTGEQEMPEDIAEDLASEAPPQ